jgi:hypothetical protein
MSIGITNNRAAQKRYAATDYLVMVKETDSSGSPLTTGDGTQWNTLGAIKDPNFSEVLDEFKDKGASGVVSTHEIKVEQYELAVTLMQRDENSRKLTTNALDKFYQVAIKGATLGTQTEFHAMWGKIMPGVQYAIGGDGQLTGIKLVTISNSAAITVALPTDWVTGTITLAQGVPWNTDDL